MEPQEPKCTDWRFLRGVGGQPRLDRPDRDIYPDHLRIQLDRYYALDLLRQLANFAFSNDGDFDMFFLGKLERLEEED